MDGGRLAFSRGNASENARTAVPPANQGAFPKKNDFLRCRGNAIAI